MALVFTREPKNMLDPNTWGIYEKAQNRRILGSLTSFLYASGADLKILRCAKGSIGIDTDDVAGTIQIEENTTIDISGLDKNNWLKIEMSILNTDAFINAALIVGATDRNEIPTDFTNAYDPEKNGYYLATTKRAIGLVWINEYNNDELIIINANSILDGYFSDYNSFGYRSIYGQFKGVDMRSLYTISDSHITNYWYTRVSAADNEWRSICWSPELGKFCAVSQTGTNNRVMTSPDGTNWTIQVSPSRQWRSVCWSPELTLFCAVAQTGTGDRVMTSPDGINWNLRVSAADNLFQSVCWSPELGLFCAVSNDGASRVMTSPDGINWTSRIPPLRQWWAICWSPELSLFCATGISGTNNRVMTSPDGTNWTLRNNPVDNNWRSICWSPELGLFCAASSDGTGDRIMTSPDGTNWSIQVSAADNNWRSICWSPELGIFCAVSIDNQNRVMTSLDGIQWNGRLTINQTRQWFSVCWSPELELFCAVSNNGTANRVMTTIQIT